VIGNLPSAIEIVDHERVNAPCLPACGELDIASVARLKVGLSIDGHRDQMTLVLVGELDLASVDEVDRLLRDTVPTRPQRLVIDLRAVELIDSAGLRLLLSLRNDAKRNGHELTLLPPVSTAGRIFVVTGTRGLFDWTH
jgi:anti-anti-sigma factor